MYRVNKQTVIFIVMTVMTVGHLKWFRWKRQFDAMERMDCERAHNNSHAPERSTEKNNVPTPKRSHTIESSAQIETDSTQMIEFQVGGGMWAYYCGISRYIEEKYDTSDCIFVGYSAGVIPIQHMAHGVLCDTEMFKKFYIDGWIRLIASTWKKALWNVVPIGTARHVASWTEYSATADPPVSQETTDTKIFHGVAEIIPSSRFWYGFSLRPRYLHHAHDISVHAKAYSCTFTIPFVTLFGIWQTIDGRMYVDHGLYSKRGHLVATNRTTGRSLERLDIWPTKWRKHPYSAYSITSVETSVWWLYRMGYADASAHPESFDMLRLK